MNTGNLCFICGWSATDTYLTKSEVEASKNLGPDPEHDRKPQPWCVLPFGVMIFFVVWPGLDPLEHFDVVKSADRTYF